MSRRFLICVLMIFCLLASSSCAAPEPDESEGIYPVYYLSRNPDGGRELGYEILSLENTQDIREKIASLLDAMKAPVNDNDVSLIPEGMEVEEIQLFGSTLVLRMNDEFSLLQEPDRTLLEAGVTLTLSGIDEISTIRVAGRGGEASSFMSDSSILLDDGELRLTTFEVEIYPVNRSTNRLFLYRLQLVTEEEELTPQILLSEMVSGVLEGSAPFDGEMDVRSISPPDGQGVVRVSIYVPVELDLRGREADVWSVVNSLFSCRGVKGVSLTINGLEPSSRGLSDCDGILEKDLSFVD